MNKNYMKKALVVLTVVGAAMFFTSTAEAGTSVSLTFSDHGAYYDASGGHYASHWKKKYRHRYYRRDAHRHGYRPSFYKNHKHRKWHRPHYWHHSNASVYGPSIIYQNVTVPRAPAPVVYQLEPSLANQAPSSYSRGNQHCREYQSNVRIGGRIQVSYGTACQQSDGVWRSVK